MRSAHYVFAHYFEKQAVDSPCWWDHNGHIDHYGVRCALVIEVNAVNFRQNLGEMLNQVQFRNDFIVIHKDGEPVAALVDAELFARIRRMRDRFEDLSHRIAGGYTQVPVEEGLAEIDSVVADERSR